MKINKFTKKLENKTDSELQEIISDKKVFVEEARLAAIGILKERNGPSYELLDAIDEIEKEREDNQRKKENINQVSYKNKYLTDDINSPKLFSKGAIRGFSLFFSTIFGAVLLIYNLKACKDQKGLNQVLIFGILFTILSVVLVNLINIRTNFALLLNLVGGVILTEHFWDKFIGKSFMYRRRSWIIPAIISLVITIPFILAMIYSE